MSWAPPRLSHLLLSLVTVVLLILTVSRELYLFYTKNAESRTTNGVGQESGESLSPLGFHSALGSTSQPSAVVRLEGDYPQNPFSPMLFFRENALSVFNGKEMVIGPRYLDTDINATTPEETFNAKEDEEQQARVPIVQSVFLLAEHKTAFALDYPISIRPLKNPNIKRFKSSYRAYSVSPTFNLTEIVEDKVGDTRWNDDIRKTYLQQHNDPRYKELAIKITAEIERPVEKAAFLAHYLTKNAIYTLSPGHDVAPDGDPVAPFLFGDRRGYCVHFAHAMVYMLRGLGIPSRIGTGYLTDLSQSKDGHILLRMSDRHAWAEVYIQGRGWVPFDVQPEKVESHAASDVDMNLLEELMGMLGPGDEILPSTTIESEPNVTPPAPTMTPARLGYALLVMLALLIAAKLYLRLSWMLPSSPQRMLRRAYRALHTCLYDLGIQRLHGETRREFRDRLKKDYGIDTLSISDELTILIYAAEPLRHLNATTLQKKILDDHSAIAVVPLWKRCVTALNPLSLSLFLSGRSV